MIVSMNINVDSTSPVNFLKQNLLKEKKLRKPNLKIHPVDKRTKQLYSGFPNSTINMLGKILLLSTLASSQLTGNVLLLLQFWRLGFLIILQTYQYLKPSRFIFWESSLQAYIFKDSKTFVKLSAWFQKTTINWNTVVIVSCWSVPQRVCCCCLFWL